MCLSMYVYTRVYSCVRVCILVCVCVCVCVSVHIQDTIPELYLHTFNKCSGRHPGGPSLATFAYHLGVYQFGSTHINFGPYIFIL